MFTENNTESRILKKISDFSKIKTKKRIVKTNEDLLVGKVKNILFSDSKEKATVKLDRVLKLFK